MSRAAPPPLRNPFLVGARLYLRAIEEADAATCYEWFSDPKVRAHLGARPWPNTEAASREWIRKVDGRGHQMFAVVTRADGRHVGNIDLMDIHWVDRHAELGIVIGRPGDQGQGYGREATWLLCDHAFRTLNLHRVGLRVYATNERAIRCYAALGFREEGRLREDAFIGGRWVDTLLMGLLEGELASPDRTGRPRRRR